VLYIRIFLACTISYFCVYYVLCVVFVFLCSFLQYFDTVGWVFCLVKTVSHITYTVLEGTLNTAQSNPKLMLRLCVCMQ